MIEVLPAAAGRGTERPARLRRFAEEGAPPGVVACVDGEPAGWRSVSPRSSHHRLARSLTIPAVDELPVWSIVCFVIRRFRAGGSDGVEIRGAGYGGLCAGIRRPG